MIAAPRRAGLAWSQSLGRLWEHGVCGSHALPHTPTRSAARSPLLTLALALFALLASLPAVATGLELTRADVAAGEGWRLFTGHFTHWTAAHFVWDWLAFVALGAALEPKGRRRLGALLLCSALAIGGAFLLFEPHLHTYRGLSGLDSALFGLAWTLVLRRSVTQRGRLAARTLAIAALGAGFVGKLAWELVTQSALFMPANSPFVPVPLAHAIGAGLGVAFGCWPERPQPRPRFA